MTALDLIFDCEIVDDMEAVANKSYNFFSIMLGGKFLLMNNKSYIEELSYFLKCLMGVDSTDCDYIDYANLEFLTGITIEGSIPTKEPCQRKQLIAIRGTCNHECPGCIEKYNGYALREIPSCNKKLVGTTVWTTKWATFSDFILDVLMWVKQCKGLDVLIINFDFTPNKYNPELNFDFIPYSILIRGSHIKFLSEKKEIEKIYKEYATTYECTDYEIENAMDYCFEKPRR